MSGDYLWDGCGPRDSDVAALERLLRPLGQSEPPPPFVTLQRATRRVPRAAVFVMIASLAATIALVVVAWSARQPAPSGVEVTRLAGMPTIGSQPMAARGALEVGRWLETDAGAHATINLGDIGRVDVDPGTRLSLLRTRPGDMRLHLQHGTVHATILAPPGQFAVETASSTAVDLGCIYTLSVGDDGVGVVQVQLGWVGFVWRGRDAFIPAGMVDVTRPGLGPGTPRFEDTSAEFRAAIDAIDLGRGPAAVADAALDRILREARMRDVVTLWHLLARVEPRSRDRVFDRLAGFVPPPAAVTRDGIRRGQREMLDAWWDGLGLGTAQWWGIWKQQWRE